MKKLIHGGDLIAAEKEFGIKQSEWLDLSTGINPFSWPIPIIPNEVWEHLPNNDDELIESAKRYYQYNSLLPIPGSQFAIQTLPKLFSEKLTVAIPETGYQEHHAAWKNNGHKLVYYSDEKLNELDEKISNGKIDIVIVINPNNPTCTIISQERLLAWLTNLKKRNGYLIVDEAFMDATPEFSMCLSSNDDHLIILKSFGKFFGLAGLRLGFILASNKICDDMNKRLGPWGVNHPARWLAIEALKDEAWHKHTREKLHSESQRLFDYLLNTLDTKSIKSTPLFVTAIYEKNTAHELYKTLAKNGVLIRYIETKKNTQLRFGLLRNEEDWKKLDDAMKSFS